MQRYGTSGWNSERTVGQLQLNGSRTAGRWLREQLYAESGAKRVPTLVLNAPIGAQAAYLSGYYAGDGLEAGNGESIKTNSALLAQGVCWLYANQGRRCSVYAEQRGQSTYFQLNISFGQGAGEKGQHLRKSASEVRRITSGTTGDDWVFDLETASGRLCAGVGRLVVHNSPRRGLEFVTRKITHAVARIKLGLDRELRLGDLDPQRDWGFAGDYVRAMWLMLQQERPDDYVIATGRTYTIRHFCEVAFEHVGLNWQEYVVQDERFMRPAEVDLLIGDAEKARERLDWRPETSFEDLVKLMVDTDLKSLQEGYRPGALVASIRHF